MFLKVVKIVWGIVCFFFLTLWCEDFYQALTYPEIYPFGAEGPGAGLWYYKTQELYLLSRIILFFWSAMGFIFCLLQNKFRNLKWGIAIHIFITLLYFSIIRIYFLD